MSTPPPLGLEFFIQELKYMAEVSVHTVSVHFLKIFSLKELQSHNYNDSFSFFNCFHNFLLQKSRCFLYLLISYFEEMPKVKCIGGESTKVHECMFI